MIDGDTLSRALFDITMPSNAPARLAPPPGVDGDTWWKVGGATWVRALPKRSVHIENSDDSGSTEARFRIDGPGIEVDEDAHWVRASDELKGLAAELVDGILRQLDASVPTLPTRALPLPPAEPQLDDWPGGGEGLLEARRRGRLAGTAALARYLDRVGQDATEGSASPATSGDDLSARLIHHLSAIPRTAETRLHLSLDAHADLVLSWEQGGDPDLLWGAAEVLWNETDLALLSALLPQEQSEGKRRLGAFAHLLAMATAVEAATGGMAARLQLRFQSVADRRITATLTISPIQWGFELPRMVQMVRQGQAPNDLRLRTAG